MKPPTKAATTTAAKAATTLSKTGMTFFGGLCVGTFGLGCWQARRYFEKIELVSQRERDLQLPPTRLQPQAREDDEDQTIGSHRRVLVQGSYRHDDEVLVGPRGPPPGSMAQSGPMSGRSSGGMGVSPQGFFVITPLERSNGGGTILVNRGWVPQQYIKQSIPWNKPTGSVDVVGVTSKTEQPRYFSPQSQNSQHPNQLLWMDRSALESKTRTRNRSPVLVLETSSSEEKDETVSFPVKPKLDTVGEYTITPAIHAGYAVTWFTLSGAGLFMTRKLLTRGRG